MILICSLYILYIAGYVLHIGHAFGLVSIALFSHYLMHGNNFLVPMTYFFSPISVTSELPYSSPLQDTQNTLTVLSDGVVAPVRTIWCYPNKTRWVTREVKGCLQKVDKEALKSTQQELKLCLREPWRPTGGRWRNVSVLLLPLVASPLPSNPPLSLCLSLLHRCWTGQERTEETLLPPGRDPENLKTSAAKRGELLHHLISFGPRLGLVSSRLW